jgi:hypothetical protein
VSESEQSDVSIGTAVLVDVKRVFFFERKKHDLNLFLFYASL